MTDDPYKRWVNETTEAWIRRAVELEVAHFCDGTWDGLDRAMFVWSARPKELADALVSQVSSMFLEET